MSRRDFAALAVLAALPVVFFAFRLPAANDLSVHLAMAEQFGAGVADGHLYPRWFADFNRGWGAPTGYFYPPALMSLTALFSSFLAGHLLLGLLAALWGFGVLGAAGILRVARELELGGWGWLAVVLWLAAPFRAFEFFSSGLYSALAAGGVAPWVVLYLLRLERAATEGRARQAAALALAYAALAVTNLPYAVMMTLLIAGWVGLRAVLRRPAEISGWVVIGGVCGAALAGIYLLPMLLHLDLVVIPQAETGAWWEGNLLFDSNAWMLPRLRRTLEDAAVFPGLALLLSLVVLRLGGGEGKAAARPGGVALLGWLGVAALFLTTPLSRPLWEWLPVLPRIDMPWRFLEVASIPAALLPVLALKRVRDAGIVTMERDPEAAPRAVGQKAMVLLSSVMAVALVATVILFGSVARMTAPLQALRSGALTPAELAGTFHERQSFFLPATARDPTTLPDGPLVFVPGGECTVGVEEWGMAERILSIGGTGGCEVLVRTFHFRGWRAEAGGTAIELRPDPETGALRLTVPGGAERVRLHFASGGITGLGGLLSLLGLGGVVALRVRDRRRTR